MNGYGFTVNEWDIRLDEHNAIQVTTDILTTILSSSIEWTYNLDAGIKSNNTWIFFGLHDSSFMYLESSLPEVESIVSIFETTESYSDPVTFHKKLSMPTISET